jgi:hypothetical protein
MKRAVKKSPYGSSVVASALMVLACCLAACGHSMSVTVKGSREPKTQTCTLGERGEVQNGGFRIVQKCITEENLTVGDGRMEMTEWDFAIEDGFADAVRDNCIILVADVEMEVNPTANPFNESLAVKGKWEFGLEEIRSLDPDAGWQTVSIDMMERPGERSPYTPQALRELILQGPWSRLSIEYGYSARISRATLDLYCK